MIQTVLVAVALVLFAFGQGASESESVSRIFPTYKDCFRFMAEHSQMKVDDASLFKLAAESSMDRYWLDEKAESLVLVIKLDYLSGASSKIRGAQDNGPYYLFVPRENGFEHVGTIEGNNCKWGTRNGKASFTTTWHVSARESIEVVYVWDGATFKVTEHALYKYSEDGSRTKIKDYLTEKTSSPNKQ